MRNSSRVHDKKMFFPKEAANMDSSSNFQPSLSSQISHELRIPLTGILGMVHFLEKTSLSVQQKEYLDCILEAAEQLTKAEAKICILVKNHSP